MSLRCGWCETHNPPERAECVNCRGPIRTPSASLGAPPPDAPRRIPDAFPRRVARSEVSFGAAFAAVGGATLLGLLVGALFVPLLGLGAPIALLFVVVGAATARSGRRRAERRVAVLRNGAVAVGQITAVTRADDGWKLAYRYEAAGQGRTGTVSSTDAEVTRFEPGFPVNVVWSGDDSDIWPPLG